jgi:hypothetical protein
MLKMITALFLAVLLIPATLLAETPTAPLSVEETPAAPPAVAPAQIVHDQLDYIVPAHRTVVKATVTDPAGVKLVRCYFKVSEGSAQLFVPMTQVPGSENEYQGTLPGLSGDTKSFEYRFLAVSLSGAAVKTQPFMTLVKADAVTPAWQEEQLTVVKQEKPAKGQKKKGKKKTITPEKQVDNGLQKLEVAVEEGEGAKSTVGISDNISLNIIESAARYIAMASSTVTISSAAAAAATASSVAAASAATASTAATTGTASVNSVAVTGQVAATTSTATVSAGTLAAVAGGIVAVGVFNMNTNAGGSNNGTWTYSYGALSCTKYSAQVSSIFQEFSSTSAQITNGMPAGCGYNSGGISTSCTGGISGSQVNISEEISIISGNQTIKSSAQWRGTINSGLISFSYNYGVNISGTCTIKWIDGRFTPN